MRTEKARLGIIKSKKISRLGGLIGRKEVATQRQPHKDKDHITCP